MASYKVLSDRLHGKTEGSVVSDADLSSANIAALIAAGHIVEVSAQKPAKKDEE